MKQIWDLYIDDSIPDRLDVFFTKLWNHKRYDELIRKRYNRIAVEKSHPLVELHLWFDYMFHCVYVLQTHLDYIEREIDMWAKIRAGHNRFISLSDDNATKTKNASQTPKN